MQISEFDYALPDVLIAQKPLEKRDLSRMLVLDRAKQLWSDSHFKEMPHHLEANDVLVINNTRVFPARLIGRRDPAGGRIEVLLTRQLEPLVWEALVRPGHRVRSGSRLRFGDSRLCAQVLDHTGQGLRTLRFECDDSLDQILDELGQTPLPPYIRRPKGSTREDRERYQTVYARARGAIAAPTAGLHFTKDLMNEVRARDVTIAEITLHVGYGTFEPVRVDDVREHRVAPECFEISPQAAKAINEARANGGRVVAVGTTTTRALESAVNAEGLVEASDGIAMLTITPGYRFRIIDALVTNFHLPRSSLLLLVCAFAGRDFVLDAYHHAVAAQYRFYSYGDCTFII